MLQICTVSGCCCHCHCCCFRLACHMQQFLKSESDHSPCHISANSSQRVGCSKIFSALLIADFRFIVRPIKMPGDFRRYFSTSPALPLSPSLSVKLAASVNMCTDLHIFYKPTQHKGKLTKSRQNIEKYFINPPQPQRTWKLNCQSFL